jgi:triacylglycerol lipase
MSLNPSCPMYFPPAPFDLAEAVRCTRLVETAYDMYAQWQAQGMPHADAFHWQPQCRFDLSFSAPIWGEDTELRILKRSEPFAFVAWSPRDATVYLSIRGTESVEDWVADASAELTDYALVLDYGRVHKGFYRVYASMAPAVRTAMNAACAAVKRPEAVFITGHSLGSSLATLAVPDVLVNTVVDGDDARVRQYNLASPRTGDATFAARYNGNGVPTYRVVNSSDLVPELPPSVLGDEVFEHVGIPVMFTAQYNSIAGNHAIGGSYAYALLHPAQPQGPLPAPTAHA